MSPGLPWRLARGAHRIGCGAARHSRRACRVSLVHPRWPATRPPIRHPASDQSCRC
jgi:hypothetical protein